MMANGKPIKEYLTIADNHLKDGVVIIIKLRLVGGGKEEEEVVDAVLKRRQSDKWRLTRSRNQVLWNIMKDEGQTVLNEFKNIYEEVIELWTGAIEKGTEKNYHPNDRKKMGEIKKDEFDELLKKNASESLKQQKS